MPTEPRSVRAIEPIDAALVPSLPIVEEALQREDASYRRRADGLDTKAGVILSAAVVIISVVGIHPALAELLGQGAAILCGAAAVLAILPRVDKSIGARQLRDRYLQVDAITTRLVLLNTRIALHERNERSLFVKALRVKIAAGLLLGSALAITIGAIVNEVSH